MSGVWNRTLVYLGLREEPDAAYDEIPARFVPEDDPHAAHAPPRPTREPSVFDRGGSKEDAPAVSASHAEASAATATDHDNVLSLPTGDVHVRAVSDAAAPRAAVVDVSEFDDVEAVGARYRTGQPVLFDLADADATTARRVVDFVSGLTYASRGELTKVAGRAFLVVPGGVALAADERRRLSDLGYRLPTGSDA